MDKKSLLQEFLQQQFLNLKNDTDLQKLLNSTAVLKKRWQKDKKKVLQATVVALHTDVPDREPILSEVQTAIIAKWPTFIANVAITKDKPQTYLRAVMLETLKSLAEDLNMAALIWHAGSNVVRHYKLGREEEIIKGFMMSIGSLVEEAAQKEWHLFNSVRLNSVEDISLKNPTVKSPNFDKDTLINYLKAASIHKGWGHGGENPQYPGYNSSAWAIFFSEKAAEGIAEVVNNAISKQAKNLSIELSSIESSLNNYLGSLKPYFEHVASTIVQSSQSLNRRSNLLWWKEALYSTKLEKSYREVTPLTTAVAMAADLAAEVPSIYPVSVDYLLKETMREVLKDKADEEIELSSLAPEIEKQNKVLRVLLPPISLEEGRKLLSVHLKDSLTEKSFISGLYDRIGIESQTKITFPDLAVWFFHDMHAVKLATSK